MMTDEQLAEIERVAVSMLAAHPTPFKAGVGFEQDDAGYYVADAHGRVVLAAFLDAPLDLPTRDYITSLTPANVLDLVSEVKRLREVAEASPLTLEVRRIVEDALENTGKLMKPLCWTRDIPTVDGEYFVRRAGQAGSAYMVQVRVSEPARVYYFGVECGDDPSMLAHDDYEWAGPVVCP